MFKTRSTSLMDTKKGGYVCKDRGLAVTETALFPVCWENQRVAQVFCDIMVMLYIMSSGDGWVSSSVLRADLAPPECSGFVWWFRETHPWLLL